MVAHLLEELRLLFQEAALQELTELGVCGSQNPGHADPRGPGSGSSPGLWRPPWVHAGTPLVRGQLLPVLDQGAAAPLLPHLQEKLGTFVLLLSQLPKEEAHTLQSHLVSFRVEGQGEVGG